MNSNTVLDYQPFSKSMHHIFEPKNIRLREEIEILRDELKDRESRLALLERENRSMEDKTKNFQIAVHELKTPLTSIIGFSELLLNSKECIDDSHVELLERIHIAGRKQLEIIEQMLHRVNKAEVIKEPVRFHKLLRNLLANIELTAKEKNLTLDVHITKDVPETIRTDQFKLERILTNLISNAVKYTDEGKIQVRVSMQNETTLVFQIEDSGRGISLHEQRTIFSFLRRGSNIKREEGMGVGLSLSQEMAYLLGGKISVYSEGKDQGSCFTLVLPRVREYAA